MKRDNLVVLLTPGTFLIVIGVSFLTRTTLPLPRELTRGLSWLFLPVGTMVFTWAILGLEQAFYGQVEPVTNELVRSVPYRWIRHPLYLGMVVLTLGVPLGFGSMWGMVAMFLLFVPAVVYRARPEEQALARKFGQEWSECVARTSFMVPPFH
jgi:protein-S-isoprenylcysteine O-methyltransferase Ste14